MALVLADRVQETSISPGGTGTLNLSGTAPAGFKTFSSGIGTGNSTYYCIFDTVAYDWEVGIGTYTSGSPGTLSRTTVLSNSAGTTSAINFTNGNTLNIFVTYPSEKSINYDANGVATIGSTLGYSDTGIIASFASTESTYNQVIVQNKSTANTASANFNVSNDAATGADNYAEFGINSSTFVGDSSFDLPGAAYLSSASTPLTIGTYAAYPIHFITNGDSTTTDAMTIYDDGSVTLGGLPASGIGNISCNNINLKFQQITTSGGTTTLTNASPYYTQFTGTSAQNLVMPDATTCLEGTTFIFDNDSTQTVTIKDGAGTSFEILVPGGFHTFILEDNSTVAGTWLRYSQVPSTVEWGTYSLSLGATVISGGTWQGGTIQSGYGGTGLTTFTAANYALYSTSASALTAGTLPVAAGGTGATTLTANGIVYGNGASAVGVTAAGTTGQVLVGNTGAAPSWATVSSSLVSSFSAGTTGFTPSTATTGAITLAGTLNVANGGTGLTSLTAGYIPYGNGTSAFSSSSGLYFSGSNLGIGTTSPSNSKLVVSGTSAGTLGAIMSVDTASTTSFIRMAGDLGSQNLINWQTGTALRFATSNQDYSSFSEKMRLDSSGNLGLGVTPSASQLPTIQSSYGILSGNSQVNIAKNAYYTTQWNYTATANASLYAQINGEHRWSYAASGTAGTAITFTQAMTLDASGRLGVGITAPNYKLNVQVAPSTSSYDGSDVTDGSYTVIGLYKTGATYSYGMVGANQSWIYSNQSDLNIMSDTHGGAIKFATGGSTERMRIDSSGNVGIGTSSPNYKLSIYDASTPRIQLTNSTTGTATTDGYVMYINGTAAYFLNREADATYFGNNNTVQATLDSSGNLGIGTSSPGVKLDVNGGSIRAIASGGTPYIYLNNGTTQHSISNSSGAMPFAIDGTERMRITSSGQVLIGTSTSPTTSSTIPLAIQYGAGPQMKFYSDVAAGMAATSGAKTTTYGSSKYAGYAVTSNGNGIWTNSSSGSTLYVTAGSSGDIVFGRFSNDPFENASTTLTSTFVIGPSGQLGIGGANYGTSGQALVSNGSGSAPSWQTVSSNTTTYGMYENNATISANYTITSGNNAISAGPITVNSGVTVTVPSGSTWTVT